MRLILCINHFGAAPSDKSEESRMQNEFTDKVAIVTGTTGIGAHCAVRFARSGAMVAAFGIALVKAGMVCAYFMLKRRQLFFWAEKDRYDRKKTKALLELTRARQRCKELLLTMEEVA